MLAAFMVIVFLGLGFVLFFTDVYLETIPRPNRYYVGAVLVIWSIFRGYFAWRRYKLSQQEDEYDEDELDQHRR